MSCFLAPTAEFVGTFLFLTVIFQFQSAIIVGATLAAIKLFIDNVSGGHVNPAITFAMVLAGRIPNGTATMYIVAQLAGAALAYVVYLYTVSK